MCCSWETAARVRIKPFYSYLNAANARIKPAVRKDENLAGEKKRISGNSGIQNNEQNKTGLGTIFTGLPKLTLDISGFIWILTSTNLAPKYFFFRNLACNLQIPALDITFEMSKSGTILF